MLFLDYEKQLCDNYLLTQLEIIYQQLKLCKMFDYKLNENVIANIIFKLYLNTTFENCKEIIFKICLYIFNHDVKFIECNNIKKIFVFCEENKMFTLNQKNQLKNQYNANYEHEAYEDEEFDEEN